VEDLRGEAAASGPARTDPFHDESRA
jgi:hypothetical protein